MRKAIIILMMCVILLTVLTACAPGGQQQGTIKKTNIYTGTKGLGMGFERIPKEVFEDEKFIIGTRLTNEGAYDIENAYITIGLEDEYMAVESWETTVTKATDYTTQAIVGIEGKSETNPKGGFELMTIKLQARNLEPQTEVHTSQVYMTACYPYRTLFSEAICLDTDIYGLSRAAKACTAKGKYAFSSQGAPVAITKIETEMSAGETDEKAVPELKIYVHNKGNGEVVGKDSYAEFCTGGSIKREDINQVAVTAKLSDKTLSCTPKMLKLGKTEDFVRCKLAEGIDSRLGAYQAIVNIELDYGYSFSIGQQVKIRRIIGK